MLKHILIAIAAVLIAVSTGTGQAQAQTGADDLVRQISQDVIETAKNDQAVQSGDMARILALVDSKVMPHVGFETVTRSAVGPSWRTATAEQRTQLQAEFKALLLRVYSGALSRVREHTVEILKTAAIPGGSQVLVHTEVRGRGQAIRLDYRLEREAKTAAWKIIDVGVGGLWLVQSYRSQFAQEISKTGLEGLIKALAARNHAATGA